jgi:hypothetical protein
LAVDAKNEDRITSDRIKKPNARVFIEAAPFSQIADANFGFLLDIITLSSADENRKTGAMISGSCHHGRIRYNVH